MSVLPLRGTAPRAASVPPRRDLLHGHLHQLDLFRVLTIGTMIAVHSFAFTNPSDSVAANGLGMVLHFTREAFFFLTGLVLVYAQKDRPLDVRRFWRRRFGLIGIPYVVWSLIYFGYATAHAPATPSWRTAVHDLGYDLLTGQSFYHLYFLVVTLQIYLLFPLLLWFVRATRRHHVAVLAASGTIQLGVTALLHYGPADRLGVLSTHAYELLPTYQFFVLLGAITAAHLRDVHTWLTSHRRAVVAVAVACGLATEAWYLLAVRAGQVSDESGASDVLQPVMTVWSVAVIVLMYLAGCRWAERRRPDSRASRTVAWLSSASFGVYLVHALVLDAVIRPGLHGPDPAPMPSPWASLVALAATLIGATLIVGVIRLTPLSLPLTGRARPPRTVAAPAVGLDKAPSAA